MADLTAADLEEIQQETSEAMRGARLQVRTAKVAEARAKLEHDRNSLAQAEAAAREAEAAATVARGFALLLLCCFGYGFFWHLRAPFSPFFCLSFPILLALCPFVWLLPLSF